MEEWEGEKFALLTHWENTLIPCINQVCTELSQKMNKRVIPIVQDDNASAHCEKNLMDYLAAKLLERGGLMMPQPPNSPQTNSCDDHVFPSMSKEGTTIQGIEDGGCTLSEGQLWINVKQVFDNFDLDKLARAFVHHQQVAIAIYKDQGSSKHTKWSGAGHFNIPRSVVPVYNDDDWDEAEAEDEAGNILSFTHPTN
jgi:hypothetical protein